DREPGLALLDEHPREQHRRLGVVLVVRRHLLEQRDRAVALARARRRLAALEREARLLVPREGAPAPARLDVPGPLVAPRALLLEPGPHLDVARGRPALAGLVRARRLRQHAHRLEQLGGAEGVAALLEEARRLRDLPLLERDLAAQVRRGRQVAAL